jgi:hypothetical protein
MNWLAQATQPPDLNFFNGPNESSELYLKIGIAMALGFAMVIACLFVPTRSRKIIVGGITFLAGLYWVAFYFWPEPAFRGPNDVPEGMVDGVGFWLSDANPVVANLANIISGFILGLGVYSLIRIHLKRLFGGHKDAFFSSVLVLSAIVMFVFGLVDWKIRLGDTENKLVDSANWGFWQYGQDLLFNGLLQVLDAAMFSMIAFFIMSAAYRAFRIRSIEATILLSAALILMLSLMGGLVVWSDGVLSGWAGNNPDHFLMSFKPSEVANWIGSTLQQPGIRAIDFGIGIGALAMGLRLWLSLERGVGSA